MKQHKLLTLLLAIVAMMWAGRAQAYCYLAGHSLSKTGDITGEGITGKVHYDAGSKVLTLDNATVKYNSTILDNHDDGLTVVVKGNCSFTMTHSNSYVSVMTDYSMTFTGGGVLTIDGPGIAIDLTADDPVTLTIKGCTIVAKGGTYGIYGRETATLVINRATVKATGSRYFSIGHWGDIKLENCEIKEPAGATIGTHDGKYKGVMVGDEVVKDEVVIVPTTINYDLQICGTQVTSGNCDDLSVIDGVKGTVSYDPDSKTLTLEGAKLNVEGNDNCINSEIDGLTIKVSGTNELNAGETAIFVYAPTTLTGGGTLNAKSEKHIAIYAYETDLTIKDCIVNVKGVYGIAGLNGSNEKLLISNATVRAEGRAGSICDFKEITLEDCAITQPAGAVVDNSQGAVVLNGEIVKSEVVITRGSDGINTPTIDTATKQGIYTLSGVKLNGEMKDLPKGVYIVNGKKVVKK